MTRRQSMVLLFAFVVAFAASVSAAMGAFSGAKITHLPSSKLQQSSAFPTGGVSALQTAQKAAFAALRRPQTDADRALADDQGALQTLADAQSASGVNPSLARSVYSVAGNQLSLIPGTNSLCLLATAKAFGQGTACASTNHAVSKGLGFVYYSTSPSGQESEATIAGVLPDGAGNVVVHDRSGNSTPVSLSPDGGYWVQATSPTRMTWIGADGRPHQITFARFRLGSQS